MDSPQPGFLSAVDSKSREEGHLHATKSVESADVLVERVLNLDVFSASLFLPFTGEIGFFFIKRY